ncbi:MAG: hypothetical protein HYY62_00435 [Deltaproteobacteria bacterium]|nr:hypothetical protein [Deltaproteobacteria bacterium]
MKSLRVLILLGIAIISFEAFGQSRAVLTVLKGGAGRALLNRTIESSPSAKAFFAGVLGLKTRQLDLIDPAIRQALITNRLNVEGPDQVRLIERARGFITAAPTRAVDLTLTAPEPQSKARPSVKVNVKLGDMTEEKVDAYVVPHSNHEASYDGVGGAVFLAGAQAGIDAFDRDLQSRGIPPFGSAFCTRSGGGNAPNLLNVVSIGSKAEDEFQVVSQSMYYALNIANMEGLSTIAAPALGTGTVGNLTAEMSAIAMMEGIQRFFDSTNNPSVQEITIIIDEDREAYDAFVKIQRERTAPAPSGPGQPGRADTNW